MSLKLIAIGCLHGKLKKEILNLIKNEKPDAVLISGDFTGGDFTDESRKYEFKLVELFGPIPELWPYKIQIDSEKKFKKWSILSKKNNEKIFSTLKKLKTPIYYIHGNWDSVTELQTNYKPNDFLLDKNSGHNMKFIHNNIINIKGFQIAGFGGYRGSSFKEYLYKNIGVIDKKNIIKVRNELKNNIEKIFEKSKNNRKFIFVTHDPPYKTFDYLESMKKNYGEKVTLNIIKKYKPLLCVCSHFHEHRGLKMIGNTSVIASGFGHNGQVSIIEIDKNKVKAKFIG